MLVEETNLPFQAKHIVMTCGAGGALNVVLKTILDEGDEVIVLVPYFMEYKFYIDNHGGIIKETRTAPDFQPDLAALEEALTLKTKAVIINSPHNPTGVVYDAAKLIEISLLLQAKEKETGKPIYLISDEPYAKIIYEKRSLPSIFNVFHRSIAVTSYSKDLALPGERIGYIAAHPEIRDVLLSGGDPFILSDNHLERIIRMVREIPHVQIIRIGTRTPVVMPQRITEKLVKMLKKYHPIWVNTHFNHPREFTPESIRALAVLADAGIPLGNQTVLLRGINDCPVIIKKLVHLLVINRVRPYYLYQCDLSRGIEHFRTPVAKGIEIMEALIGHTSGFCVPHYVVDAPGGGGKIPVLPHYQLSITSTKTVLRNYEGVICVYEEPKIFETVCPATCTLCKERKVKHEPVGLQKLFDPLNQIVSLVPEGNRRKIRNSKSKGVTNVY